MSAKQANVWIARKAMDAMTREADQRAPLETGGILIGYRSLFTNEPVIAMAVGPGQHAIHDACQFVPDHEYHVAVSSALYRASGRRLVYLGDWHSHPGGGHSLSRLDRETLCRIARSKEARAPRPLMIIMAPGPEWTPRVWEAELRVKILFRQPLKPKLLSIHMIDDLEGTDLIS